MLRVPAHWRLLSFCFFVVVVAILFEGIATHTVGASAEPHESGGQAPLVDSRPILVAQGSHLVSRQPPPGRRIALTFDDGPDPRVDARDRRCPARCAGVRATFFVIGSEVARYPDLVRTLVRDGDEIGNHTFTHVAAGGRAGMGAAASSSS